MLRSSIPSWLMTAIWVPSIRSVEMEAGASWVELNAADSAIPDLPKAVADQTGQTQHRPDDRAGEDPAQTYRPGLIDDFLAMTELDLAPFSNVYG
jgi:hypothetical protein